MSDLISRQAAIDSIEKHIRTGDELYPLTSTDKILNHAFEIAASCVYNLSTADVAPVRHGRLTINRCKVGGYDYAYYKCTACGRLRPMTVFQFDFCPFCGAKMDGGEDGKMD